MVNDEVYKSVVSPVLKPNDEICLGYQEYTYKFMLDYQKGTDSQVEKLKNDEILMVSMFFRKLLFYVLCQI